MYYRNISFKIKTLDRPNQLKRITRRCLIPSVIHIFFYLDFLFAVMQHHLSESDDIPPSPMSPLAPPLPEGTVVASEKRMVIVRQPPRSIDGSQSRLNSVEIVDSARRHKVYT